MVWPVAFQISNQYNCITAPNPLVSWINTVSCGIMFNLDTFNATTQPFTEKAYRSYSETSPFIISPPTIRSNTGSRCTTGIQSNGSGHGILDDVRLQGLKYGFAGPYGSDFDQFINVESIYDDVGIYMGFDSEQFTVTGQSAFGQSGEGFVCNDCVQGSFYNPEFSDDMTADFVYESFEGASNFRIYMVWRGLHEC